MDPKIKAIISFVIPSILFICISWPLIKNKIPPNCAYGFRLRKTLSNKEIWYKANKFGGQCVLTAGIITLISCCWLWMHKEGLSLATINEAGIKLLILPLTGAIVLSLTYIKKL